jgi:hypothetical protein
VQQEQLVHKVFREQLEQPDLLVRRGCRETLVQLAHKVSKVFKVFKVTLAQREQLVPQVRRDRLAIQAPLALRVRLDQLVPRDHKVMPVLA